MSVEAMAIALHHSRANGAAKLVLVGIANHDGDGGAWPSMPTLATYAGINERNTHYAVEKLVQLGEISVEINGGGGRQTADHMQPNLYHFLLKCPPNCDGTRAHRMLCVVCSRPLPSGRRRLLHHLACPLPSRTPPVTGDRGVATDRTVAHDTRPLSQETGELNPEASTTDTQIPNVPERAQAREEIDELPLDACPRRLFAPHAYDATGRCIDCDAVDAAATEATSLTPTPIGATA